MPSPKSQNDELRPYIPYLLKDLWEMGNIPAYKFELLSKNLLTKTKPAIIDMGCGKGSELIQLALKFEFEGTGIDIFPEFIEEANFRKRLNNCGHLQFIVDDFILHLSEYKDFNIVIFEYDSKVFGSIANSLINLKSVLKGNKGYILFDAAVLNDIKKIDTIQEFELYKNVKEQILSTNFTILGYIYWNVQYLSRMNEFNYNCISRRVGELIEKEPDKEALFNTYLEYQKYKSQLMLKDINCITWLLRTN